MAETFVRSFVHHSGLVPHRKGRERRCGNNRAKQIFVLFLGILGAIVIAIPSTGTLGALFPSILVGRSEMDKKKEREGERNEKEPAEQRRVRFNRDDSELFEYDFPTTREKCLCVSCVFRRRFDNESRRLRFLGSVD